MIDRIVSAVTNFFISTPALPASSKPRITKPDDYPEERVILLDEGLAAKLPNATVYLVKNSRSAFYVDPVDWIKNGRRWDTGGGNHTRFSIEVEDGLDNVVAAVGWTNYLHDVKASYTFGTYVSPKLQNRGIGKALWRAMIKNCERPMVHGTAITNKGLTLLKSMKENFPGVVDFEVDADSNPRDLRKTKKVNKAKKKAYKKARAA